VATKAHSQYELALIRVRKSLELYGLSQPSLAYTDNMSDKGFLEKSFPSLRAGVVPVEKYGDLDEYCLPPSVEIIVKNEPSSINAAMETILDDVPSDDPDTRIVVGFDSEWNVEVSIGGRVHERGHTSIIQIAYKNRVYILQVGASQILFSRSLGSYIWNFPGRRDGGCRNASTAAQSAA